MYIGNAIHRTDFIQTCGKCNKKSNEQKKIDPIRSSEAFHPFRRSIRWVNDRFAVYVRTEMQKQRAYWSTQQKNPTTTTKIPLIFSSYLAIDGWYLNKLWFFLPVRFDRGVNFNCLSHIFNSQAELIVLWAFALVNSVSISIIFIWLQLNLMKLKEIYRVSVGVVSITSFCFFFFFVLCAIKMVCGHHWTYTIKHAELCDA